MAKKENLEELKNSENWDFEEASKHFPSKPQRVVVSVAFPRHEFDVVAAYAAEHNRKVSEFIRESAVNEASKGKAYLSWIWGGGMSIVLMSDKFSIGTLTNAGQLKEEFLPIRS